VPTTDEELQQKKDKVVELRQQVADANTKREIHEKALENDIVASQLDVERVRLEMQLAAALADSKVSAVKGGVDAPLQAAKDDMAVAVAQQKAAEKAATAASSDSTK